MIRKSGSQFPHARTIKNTVHGSQRKPGPVRILIFAGSDSSAGAGVQADLKTASALGVYGLTVITAITSQNTKGVQNVLQVSRDHIVSQFESIHTDIGFAAIKIGMLGNKNVADTVYALTKDIRKPVILDPVLIAQSGGRLSVPDIFDRLFGIAALITPNAYEAAVLSGITIRSVQDMEKAAKILLKKTKCVLIKGGDTKIDFDVYAEKGRIERLPIERIKTANTHGTGCSLASAIASLRAIGLDMYSAVVQARQFIRTALSGGVPLGSRFGTIDQFASIKKEAARYRTISALQEAYQFMRNKSVGILIPEVQSNLVFILPFGQGHQDVAGFSGRIIRAGDDIYAPFWPDFGASRHIASVALTANRHFPEVRSAMAVRYIPSLIGAMKKAGFVIARFDRRKEPKAIKQKEGSSLDWGVSEVCRNAKKAPDAVYDEGDVGKEPVIRVLGKNPMDVARKVIKISSLLKGHVARGKGQER